MKDCKTCGKPIFRRYKAVSLKNPRGFYYRYRSDKQWEKVKYCSRSCFSPANSAYHKGRPSGTKGTERSNEYGALHVRWNRKLKKPKRCQHCKKVKPLELCNVSHKYLNEAGDWVYLCRRCHMIQDGRIEELKKHSFKKK